MNTFAQSANLANTAAIKLANENAGWTEYILLGDGNEITSSAKISELLDEHNMFKDESSGEVYEGRSIFFSQTTGMSTYVLPEGAQYRRTREWLTNRVLPAQADGTNYESYQTNTRLGSTRPDDDGNGGTSTSNNGGGY